MFAFSTHVLRSTMSGETGVYRLTKDRERVRKGEEKEKDQISLILIRATSFVFREGGGCRKHKTC